MTTTKTKYRTFGLAAIVAILTVSMVAMALSQSAVAAPANKTMIGDAELIAIPYQGEDEDGWTTIVSGEIKTSTPSDLIVSHNQECAIHTGLNLDERTEEATSAIREEIRLRVDGTVVPATYGDTEEKNGDQYGLITMCGRAYHIDTNVLSTLFDLCQVVAGIEGVAFECPDEIFFDSFIRTKQAHSWDWVVLNVGSGVHTVEVQAKLHYSLEAIGDGEKKKGKATDSGVCPTNDDNCVDTVLELGKRNLIVIEDKLSTWQTLG